MRIRLQPLFDSDAGGGSGGVLAGDPPAPPPAGDAGGDRLAELERELGEARAQLTARQQAEAEAQRRAAEEAGNFKKLYEDTQAQLATVAAERAAQTAREMRLAAATAAGLDAELATRLVGDTPEALAADAKKLAQRLAPAAPSTGATNPGASRRGAATIDEQINADFAKRSKRAAFRIS